MKTWDELTISDNFIFQHVMQDPQICKEFLEKLLSIEIRNITYVDFEKIFDIEREGKGIRLDVYAEDDKDAVYDVEMQTTNNPMGSLSERTRYYQAMLVANLIKKGQDYTELKKTFVIFVCTFDPFNEGRRIYTFKNICVESKNLELGDGSTTIFLNAKGDNGKTHKDIKNFLNLVNGKKALGKFITKILERIEVVKRNDKMKVDYMSWYAEEMRIRRIARDEGKAEIIKNLLSESASMDLISKVSGWTKEKIIEFAQKENIKVTEE